MKKFKFSLAKVLVQRQIAADLAHKNFAEAKAVLDAEIEKLNEMIDVKKRSLVDRATVIQNSSDWVKIRNEVAPQKVFAIRGQYSWENLGLKTKTYVCWN